MVFFVTNHPITFTLSWLSTQHPIIDLNSVAVRPTIPIPRIEPRIPLAVAHSSYTLRTLGLLSEKCKWKLCGCDKWTDIEQN